MGYLHTCTVSRLLRIHPDPLRCLGLVSSYNSQGFSLRTESDSAASDIFKAGNWVSTGLATVAAAGMLSTDVGLLHCEAFQCEREVDPWLSVFLLDAFSGLSLLYTLSCILCLLVR